MGISAATAQAIESQRSQQRLDSRPNGRCGHHHRLGRDPSLVVETMTAPNRRWFDRRVTIADWIGSTLAFIGVFNAYNASSWGAMFWCVFLPLIGIGSAISIWSQRRNRISQYGIME
jgi:hypothetical protein